MSKSVACSVSLILWAALGLYFASPAIAADEIRKAATPLWVDDAKIPAPRPDRLRQVKDGIYYLLSDTQVWPEGAREDSYYRYAYQVTDRRGLEEAARLEVEFDPSYESVVFHRVRILRNGVALDRLNDIEPQVLQREQDLDKGVVDGRKTAHLEVKDVRVGDVIDYSYSLQSRLGLWPGQFFDSMTMRWSIPVGLTRYRLIWTANRQLTIRNQNSNAVPTRTTSGQHLIYEWRATDAEPIPNEDGTPEWYPTWGRISLSSIANWSDVAAWTLPLYAHKDSLPPALEARAAAIVKRFRDPKDRTTQALRLVQDELRYVSISIGAGSFVPRSPSEVFRSGYGDCKDKSQLLVALLRRMGIEAFPALTHMEKGRALPQRAPAPTAFDHVIVQVKIGGHTYWLDPTGSHEGGRMPNLTTLDYGWALPIAPGQQGLEQLPAPKSPEPTFYTIERYELPSDASRPLTLRVTSVYLGDDADWMRDDLAKKSLAQIETDYLTFYASVYPSLKLAKPLRYTDDRDRNKVVVYEAYSLSAEALRKSKLNEKFVVKASSLTEYNDPPTDNRKTPYQLTFPVHKRQTIVFVTPGHRPPAPHSVSLTGTAFRYNLDVKRNNDTLTLDYSLVGTKQVLYPDQIAAYRQYSAAVEDDNYWYLDLTSNAGGYIGERNDIPTLSIGVAISLGILLAALFGVWRGLHADDAYSNEGFYYPVATPKFLLMVLLTTGMYSFFWAWKCWRWAKSHGAAEVSPFWRAAFGVFWLYPLFENINGGKQRVLPQWVGATSAMFYLIFATAGTLVSVSAKNSIGGELISLGSVVCLLPTVFAVNKLNVHDSPVLSANSKITWTTVAAVLFGLFNWTIFLFAVSRTNPSFGLGNW